MIVRGTRKTFALLTLVVVAVLCYLELYPFAFRMPTDGEGPFRKLIESWAERPSRGDFVANVLAYIPLGLFATLALASPRTVLRWSPVVTIVGAALSVVLELTAIFCRRPGDLGNRCLRQHPGRSDRLGGCIVLGCQPHSRPASGHVCQAGSDNLVNRLACISFVSIRSDNRSAQVLGCVESACDRPTGTLL